MKDKIPVWVALLIAAGAAVLTLVMSYLTQSVLMHTVTFNQETKASDRIDEAVSLIDRYFVGDWELNDAIDGAIDGIVESLGDEWSYYIPADEMELYRNDSANRYDGLGIVIQKNETGGILITSVYDVSPAADAGIIPGSIIYFVDGQNITDYTLDQAKETISNSMADGEVSISIIDPDGMKKEYTLVPGKVELIPVKYSMLESGIGYIRIENFKARSGKLIIDAVENLQREGAKSLIFDVRFNPGGGLDELLEALDYLLPEGTLFISKTRGGTEVRQYSAPSCVEMPMAVLINSESYSAAEFFSAALSEYEWATLVGEKTTGKGYAQTNIGMSDGSALHISIEEYFTPKGISLAGVGLTPDVEVDLSDNDFALLYYNLLAPEDDAQLQAAIALLAQ